MIDVGAIGQDHIGKGALVLVVAVRLDGDVLPEGEGRDGVLGLLPISLALLRTVDAAETYAFSVVTVQGFDGVAVDHSHNFAGVLGSADNSGDEQRCQQQEWCPVRDQGHRTVATNYHRVALR